MPAADDARAALVRLQARLADVLLAADPAAACRELVADEPVLAAVDADGLRLAALLVAKLRFERLMNGSTPARQWFERDARAFTQAFRQYHRAVPPTAGDPWAEAAAFAAWAARTPIDG